MTIILDVDECLTGNGGCSDICTNTIGSFECSCEADRVLDIDQKTCVDNTDSRTGGSKLFQGVLLWKMPFMEVS